MDHFDKKIEYAILVGLVAGSMTPKERSSEASLLELGELVKTAGGEVLATASQNLSSPEPKTFIGSGKAAEIAELSKNMGATLVVFDNDLSPAQTKNLEEIIGVRVVDRSTLILDIFAARAKTAEGKLQVELAQYRYTLPRLTGKGLELSRLGGGIGTRGPGETKLETDRRHIRERIGRLEAELENVRKTRGENRRQRIRSGQKTVSLVGYTNAGKSTLLNLLSGSDIPANNRLFDTLDPTTRKTKINDTLEVLLTDTVGFIRKLPHQLIRAFRATLEELKSADLILHVVDASSPDFIEEAAVSEELISELSLTETPRITVFNKIDLAESIDLLPIGENIAYISAKTGEGIEALLDLIGKALDQENQNIILHLPYDKMYILDLLHRQGKVISIDYKDSFVLVNAVCPKRYISEVTKWQVLL